MRYHASAADKIVQGSQQQRAEFAAWPVGTPQQFVLQNFSENEILDQIICPLRVDPPAIYQV